MGVVAADTDGFLMGFHRPAGRAVRLLPEHRTVVQVSLVELGQFHQPVKVVEHDVSLEKRQQTVLAQLAQHAVYMDSIQAECVCEQVMGQGTGIAFC